jgi:hypothetical protein
MIQHFHSLRRLRLPEPPFINLILNSLEGSSAACIRTARLRPNGIIQYNQSNQVRLSYCPPPLPLDGADGQEWSELAGRYSLLMPASSPSIQPNHRVPAGFAITQAPRAASETRLPTIRIIVIVPNHEETRTAALFCLYFLYLFPLSFCGFIIPSYVLRAFVIHDSAPPIRNNPFFIHLSFNHHTSIFHAFFIHPCSIHAALFCLHPPPNAGGFDFCYIKGNN